MIRRPPGAYAPQRPSESISRGTPPPAPPRRGEGSQRRQRAGWSPSPSPCRGGWPTAGRGQSPDDAPPSGSPALGAGRGWLVVTGTMPASFPDAPRRAAELTGELADGPVMPDVEPSTGGIAAAQLEGFQSGAGTVFVADGWSARSMRAGGMGPPFPVERRRGGCRVASGGVV